MGHYLRAAGHTTVLTREADKFVQLKQRAKIAKQAKCNLFLSIHLNAATNPNARGCEAFYAAPDKGRSIEAARMILHTINGITTIPIRGVKRDSASQHKSLTVLRSTYSVMPAVLVELGFLTNAKDRSVLTGLRTMETLALILATKLGGVATTL